jgi:hypothetical protein
MATQRREVEGALRERRVKEEAARKRKLAMDILRDARAHHRDLSESAHGQRCDGWTRAFALSMVCALRPMRPSV